MSLIALLPPTLSPAGQFAVSCGLTAFVVAAAIFFVSQFFDRRD